MKSCFLRFLQCVIVLAAFTNIDARGQTTPPSWWANLETVAASNSINTVIQNVVPLSELMDGQLSNLDVIVIPLEAFEWALQDPVGVDVLGNRFYEADEQTIEQVIRLNALANHPSVQGAFSTLLPPRLRDGYTFEGDNFIVAMDAKVSHDGQTIEFTKFFTAAVSLTGYSAWVGKGIYFGTTGNILPGDDPCCGIEDTETHSIVCGGLGKGVSPIPNGCGITAICPRDLDPYTQPHIDLFDFSRGSPIDHPLHSPIPSDPWATNVQRLSGQAVKPIFVLETSPPLQEEVLIGPLNGMMSGPIDDPPYYPGDPPYSPDPHTRFAIKSVYRPHTCETCKLIDRVGCFEAPPIGPGDIPNNPCSLAPHDVPLTCQQMNPVHDAGTCGAYSHQRHDWSPNACSGPTRSNVSGPWTRNSVGTNYSGTANVCREKSPHPDWCDRVSESGNHQCYTSENTRTFVNNFWINDVLGCRNGGSPSSDVTCIEGGACKNVGSNIYFCIDCNDAGTCREYTARSGLGDPRVMGETEKEKEHNDVYNDDTQRFEFPAFVLSVEIPEEHQSGSTEQVDMVIAEAGSNQDTENAKANRASPNGTLENHGLSPGSTLNLFQGNIDVWNISQADIDSPIISNGEEKSAAKERAPTKGDPVLLADGSLEINHLDFSLPGAVRPFEFRRNYNSRSTHRGILGNNWSHNYEVRIQKITAASAPAWASPYCRQTGAQPNCLLYEDGRGNTRVFYRDLGSASEQVYTPQAGSTDTIIAAQNGWVLRGADGHKRIFNSFGYMTHDHDRFGNGVVVEYEHTLLHFFYNRYCNAETAEQFKQQKEYDARLCDILAYNYGDAIAPEIYKEGLPSERLVLNQFPPGTFRQWPEIGVPFDFSGLSGDYGTNYSRYFHDAYSYIYQWLKVNIVPENPTGNVRMRPKSITDNMGRRLVFSYYTHIPISGSSLGSELNFSNGLLKSIDGPQGIRVEYNYDRPADDTYDSRLADMFLVNVERSDRSPSDNSLQGTLFRTYDYEYAWPEEGSIHGDSYKSYAENVKRRYLTYFSAYNGCIDEVSIPCPPNNAYLLQGNNPCLLATIAQNNYMKSVADNIVRVTRSGIIEVESLYIHDPTHEDFDKVVMQRYGGIYSGKPEDGWSSRYPSFLLEYIHPADMVSRADVPDILKGDVSSNSDGKKYPLDTPPQENCRYGTSQNSCYSPPVSIDSTLSCDKDTFAYDQKGCDFGNLDYLEKLIPGNDYMYNYYSLEDAFFDFVSEWEGDEARITQTHLNCNQIAAAQVGDPLHAGLVAKLHKKLLDANVPEGPFQIIAEYDQRSKERIADDMLRICQWVKVVDRDRDIQYFGLNFRGQTLVKVNENFGATGNEQLVFEERHFNADGKIVFEKHPHTSSQSTGHSIFKYDEIDPTGANGHNAFIPGFWTRRHNLLEKKTYYSLEVPNRNAHEISDSDLSAGHYISYRYEPLFNQLRTVETGSLDASLNPVWNQQIHYDFDYQELSWGNDERSSPIAAYLISLIPYGWAFDTYNNASNSNDPHLVLKADLTKLDGTVIAANYLRSWQFPIHFYGQDLNGDGVLGSPFGDEFSKEKVRGVPVRMTLTSSQAATEPRHSSISWAAQGNLAGIYSDDGSFTQLEYYSSYNSNLNKVYGADFPPAEFFATSNDGLLARVKINRIDNDYPELHAPSYNASELANDFCEQMPGPYRYLIPGGCSDPSTDLDALGLPLEVITALNNASVNDVYEFSYNHIGHVSNMWENGRRTKFETDLDGRIVKKIDPQGVITEVMYSTDGWPISEQSHSQGQILSQTRRIYDAEGHVLAECNALEANGCVSVFSENADIYVQLPELPWPGLITNSMYQLSMFNYTSEGQVSEYYDPSGTVTYYDYDSNKRLVYKETVSIHDVEDSRSVFYEYDVFGRLTRVGYGSVAQRSLDGELDEFYVYDAAGRLVYYIDQRLTKWRMHYDSRGRLTQVLLEDNLANKIVPEGWRNDFVYNGFDELIQKIEHNHITTSYSRTADGRLYRIDRTGLGPVFVTFDVQGNPVWVRDAAGNSQIQLSNHQTNQVSNISLQKDERDGSWTSLSEILQFNANKHLVDRSALGHGGVLSYSESWLRNGLGHVKKHVQVVDTNVDEVSHIETVYTHNLAGWPLSECRHDEQCSYFTYDQLGKVVAIQDPTGQITTSMYTGLGQLYQTIRPGSSSPAVTWTYDGHGRPKTRQDADERQQLFSYVDGDLVYTQIVDVEGYLYDEQFEERDALGRITVAMRANAQLQNGFSQQGRDPISLEVYNVYEYDNFNRPTAEWMDIFSSTHESVISYSEFGQYSGRFVSLPTGSSSEEAYDSIGRLEGHNWQTSLQVEQTEFLWKGQVYAGRSRHDGYSEPVRESAEFDSNGLRTSWVYSALEMNNGWPVSGGWADDYCDDPIHGWNEENCAKPLLAIGLTRGFTGRINEVLTQFGFPNGNPRNDNYFFHDSFKYKPIGHLAGSEQIRISNTWNDGRTLDFQREPDIGSLNAIIKDNAAVMWTADRGNSVGHRLNHVYDEQYNVAVLDIDHDKSGNIAGHFLEGTDTVVTQWSYEFDGLGQLVAVHDSESKTYKESYIYDHRNRLVGIIDENETLTIFHYDGDNIVAATKDGDTLWEAAWGPGTDRLIGFHDIANHKAYVPLADYRNSIVAAWNATDLEINQTAEYDPNGVTRLYDKQENILCDDGDCPNVNNLPFGFTSALRSDVTGLIHMRARWYSPRLAQFISPDPLGYIDSYNLYAYAGFDPINYWDPYGLSVNGFVNQVKEQFSLKGRIRERLENSSFVREGFRGNDVPSSYRVGGIGGLLRDGGNAIDAQIDATAVYLHEMVEEREAKLINRRDQSSGVFAKAHYNTMLQLHYMERALTPESSLELRLDLGLAFGGLVFKGRKAFGNVSKINALSICSFTEDTPVLMCDGSLKPIQQIRAGEFVLSRSEETGEFGCREVVDPYSNADKAIIRIELLALDGTFEVIEATANHPFYVEGQGWTRVDELATNDLVPGSTGELLRVVALESTDRVETVFNFGVEEFHSYFVGELGVWVHNCNKFWDGLKSYRGSIKMSGSGKKRRYYEWDYTHDDIEVYDRIGRHLGSADPKTGDLIKPPVNGRKIDL